MLSPSETHKKKYFIKRLIFVAPGTFKCLGCKKAATFVVGFEVVPLVAYTNAQLSLCSCDPMLFPVTDLP
jgi:hypothetical protein